MYFRFVGIIFFLASSCDNFKSTNPITMQRPNPPCDTHDDRPIYTDTHVYTLKEALGRGATADVYKGYERTTGAVRALKVTKSTHETRETNREIAALVTLSHDNIVKMIAIETESQSGCVVLVTEFCPGGSLFTFLQEPENTRGLPDAEFHRLLSGLAYGLKHIRDHGFVHRDLKPGNILRSFDSTGRSIYKIADFGAARQLDENERYLSLAGTEEYLHPDVYYTAFFDRRSGHEFTASSDLWSLGATLFHAASGETPFKPFRGARKDRETMQRMLSEKPRGVIRGVQDRLNGSIQWGKTLSSRVKLSRSMSRIIEPMLRCLLEKDASFQWSFVTFFKQSQDILGLVGVPCCHPAKGSMETVYLNPSASFETAKNSLEKITGIPASRQVVLLDGTPLGEGDSLARLLKLQQDSPIVVLDKAPPSSPDEEDALSQSRDLPEKEPVQPLRRFSTRFDFAEDVIVCLENCFQISRIIEKLVNITILQRISTCLPMAYCRSFAIKLAALEQRIDAIEVVFKERCHRLEGLIVNFRTRVSKFQPSENVRKAMKLRAELSELLMRSKQTLKEMKDWIKQTPHLVNSDEKWCTKCLETAQNFFCQMKEVLKSMRSRKKKENPVPIETLYHKADRLKMESVSNEVYAGWHSHCSSSRSKTRKGFLAWNNLFIENMRKETEFGRTIEQIVELNFKFENILREISEDNSVEEVSAKRKLDQCLNSIPKMQPSVILESNRLTQDLEGLIASLPDVTLMVM